MKKTFIILLMIAEFVITYSNAKLNNSRETLFYELVSNRNYNSLIVPTVNSKPVQVTLDVVISELVGVNEQNEYLETKLWLAQTWIDYRLSWNPSDYNGVNKIHIPPENLWLPDIVLYNNNDGEYKASLEPVACIYYNGTVKWRPPAIYRSSCSLEVAHFPFDSQTCKMHFKSWTYDNTFVDLMLGSKGATLEWSFQPSGEWEIISMTGHKIKNSSHGGALEYRIDLTRKPMFYVAFIVLPCVILSFMNIVTFYLPSASGEKMTLCISVLLALTVFLFLISKVVAPTSMAVPMIGKFITLSMSLVTTSVVASVLVINIELRSPHSHVMPHWMRVVFLELFPKLLKISRPSSQKSRSGYFQELADFFDAEKRAKVREHNPIKRYFVEQEGDGEATDGDRIKTSFGIHLCQVSGSCYMANYEKASNLQSIPPDALGALNSTKLLADQMKEKDQFEMVKEDWKFMAMVIDKIFFIVFFFVTAIGTIAILL